MLTSLSEHSGFNTSSNFVVLGDLFGNTVHQALYKELETAMSYINMAAILMKLSVQKE